MRVTGVLAVSGLTLFGAVIASAQALPGPPRGLGSGRQARSTLPTVRLGALLPLSGAAAWFGIEMRRGMELAVAEVNPAAPAARQPAGASDRVEQADTATDSLPRADDRRRPPPEFELALEALDVSALDVHNAATSFRRLAATSAIAVFTASVTPTLAVYRLAAAQDILIVHQGVRGPRFPRESRTLLHTRPPLESRVDALTAYARQRGFRRLAVFASGDDFGRAARAALTGSAGPSLVHVESLTIDAPDLASRFRRLARLRPDAVALGFQGAELGDVAGHLRQAGYAGPLLALDDDQAARLAAGRALDGALLVVDAFVPEPGGVSERFARAYASRFGSPPSRYAANAYEAVGVLAEGLRTTGPHAAASVGGGRLREALAAQQRFPSVYGGEVTLRDDGTLERPLALFEVDQGELVFLRYLAPRGAAG